MKDLLILAVPMLFLAMLYCGWRAVDLFRTRIPAAATVWKSGYSDLEREDDFWHFGSTLGTIRGWNWRDGENARLIEEEVVFTDQQGERHHALVERRVRRGWRPINVYTIWYDPNDPSRATAFGPGHWLMLAVLFCCMLVSVFGVGVKLAGR